MKYYPKILLAMEDDRLLCEFADQIESKVLEVKHVKSFDKAKEQLTKENVHFNGIFVDPELDESQGLGIIDLYHRHHVGVPFYLIHDQIEKIIGDITTDELGIHGAIHDPSDIAEVINIIHSNMGQFDHKRIVQIQNSNEAPSDDLENDLVAINARNFLSGSQTYFDIYVKLNQGKFLKVLHAGDSFEAERLNSFLDKGLNYLFINKSAQSDYLNFCAKLTSEVLKNSRVKIETKIVHTMNQGQEVINFLRNKGIDSESIKFAQDFSLNVNQVIKQLKSENIKTQKLTNEIINFDHTVSTTMIAGLIGREYGLGEQECANILGVGAALHDIGLSHLENEFKYNSKFKIFEEQDIELELQKESIPTSRKKILQKKFEEHPTIGARVVREIDNVDAVVVQIIAQHHMRIDGTGFPQLGMNSIINPLSQIVGLADEYTKLVKNIVTRQKPSSELADFNLTLRGFSPKVVKAFTKFLNV